MVTYFKDRQIVETRLKMSFIGEKGQDACGVSREAYTAFWYEFMERQCEGEELRVHALCPEWQAEEWMAVGRILLKGFKDHKIFPVRLAPAFVCGIIFGEESLPNELLFDSFMKYISARNRELVTLALQGSIAKEDMDEYTDFLEEMDWRNIPSVENTNLQCCKLLISS
jgi:hypothetical protein